MDRDFAKEILKCFWLHANTAYDAMIHLHNDDLVNPRFFVLDYVSELPADWTVEINGGPAQEEAYRQAMARFYGLAREMGARFTVTADAHHPGDFERLDLAVGWARGMGVRDEELVTVEELVGRVGG